MTRVDQILAGDTLARKIIVAIAERDRQVAEFTEIDRTLSKEFRKKWQKKIDKWLADKSQPNPYCLAGGKNGGPSEAAVFLELKTAEAQEAAEGREAVSASTAMPTAFVKAGMQLEESQRRIKAELKGVTLVTADRASQIQEMWMSFLKKLRTYERLQLVFMPGVAALKAEAEEARDTDAAPPKAEDITLWLPSELKAATRRAVCRKGVASGRRIGDRIARVAAKYRRAREALIELKGENFALQFKVLAQGDLNTNAEQESDAKARRKLGRLGSSKRSRLEPSDKLKSFSWLWTAGGGPGEDQEQLHDSVRVEWSKAKGWKDRWIEEVRVLWEEMKRVLRMLRWIQVEWAIRAERRVGIAPELAGGLRAYALCQVYVHRRIAEAFHAGWSHSVAGAVRQVVERDGGVYRELLEGEGLDKAPSPSRSMAPEEVSEEEDAAEEVTARVTRSRGKQSA
ncbi:hypothetical protein DFH06DRAFT_1150855 [Mycena polygramma]|nr:hypothetical protein DFH06DRAFT_1150855 [Mycena polygramma]